MQPPRQPTGASLPAPCPPASVLSFPFSRALSYGALVVAWAVLGSCLSAPTGADWLAVGFGSPTQTFRAFQTGLRGDQPDLEYRCLSGGFKHAAGVSQTLYREFRSELFRRQPWLKLAARAEVIEQRDLAPDRVRLVARVDTWFHDQTFEIDFVREDFYELWVDGARVADDGVPWSELARETSGKLVVSVPLPAGLSARGVGELCAGHEWKIDGFPAPADADSP